MSNRSPEYVDAVQAVIAADEAFGQASIAEMRRLMPEGVEALILRVNDTPRLTFDAFIDADGEEQEAEDIDLIIRDGEVYDAIDEVAMQMDIRDNEDASNWFVGHDRIGGWDERFILTREDRT